MKKFNEKLNVRFDKKAYTVEEEIHLSGNKYESFLKHDNIDVKTVNVYSGSKLSGDKINSYVLSVDEELPWRTYIVINSNLSTVYISYETIGDTVEAEDINELQEAITETDADLQAYKTDSSSKVKQLRTDVNSLDNRKAEKTFVESELNKRYLKTETYNKEEVKQKIQELIGSAPDALNTLQEIANALGNDSNFASTITNKLATKVDKVSGKQLSTNDYTTIEKQKLAGIEQNANRYIHPASHQASMIVENSDKRFVSDLEKEKWNTVDNKINSENGELGDTITTFTVANTRENIQSKEKTKTVLGKIAKYFSDLKTLAFTANWNDIVNKPSTYNPNSHTHSISEITNFPNQDIADLKSNKHNHNNKSVLDKITQAILDNISSAYAHISDNVKHITAQERTKWNKVDNKIDTSLANNTFATKQEVTNARYGDMLKSVYDTNNDGKVDVAKLAESIAWNNISGKPSAFTPLSHTHTKSQISDFAHTHDDRYYTESEINSKLSGKADTSHNHNSVYYTKSEIDNRIKKAVTWGKLKGGL